ncbi:Ldh family oxidoreductase [Nocardiopsis alkaliphila]|uniref:Ldh family oxidoreductase n=1 Tax=Nocardiopsis alkaliphila TaxID=225762 RepID=UPI00034745A3|nr:Ldh family oxidoreductase [Nocardiopsis alkaliphila]
MNEIDHARTDEGGMAPEGERAPERVRTVVTAALASRGVRDAKEVADLLVETSLLGIHTHGVRMLSAYIDELDRGVARPDPSPRIFKDTGPVVQVDADGALGASAALNGTRIAVERARAHGVGVVGVRGSNHFGAAGAYARRIAAEGLLGFVTTSAASRVAPFGGIEALFGTNPVAIAFGPDFCLDMATSQVCFGEIKERRRTGQDLEPGWALDPTGDTAIRPDDAGALSPLGGYKGHGLAMAVSVLTAVLVGGPLDFQMAHIGTSDDGADRGVAHLFIALDPSAFGGREAARERMSTLVDRVRTAESRDPASPVLAPGDPQREHEARQSAGGLELDGATLDLLRVLEAEMTAGGQGREVTR